MVRLWTDNQVKMYVFENMVSRSPALMSEIRRLRNTLKTLGVELELKYLPSALSLYADRLSRHRKAWHWYLGVRAIPDCSWVRASDYDWSVSWRTVDFMRPLWSSCPSHRSRRRLTACRGRCSFLFGRLHVVWCSREHSEQAQGCLSTPYAEQMPRSFI
jgi:hypothetical protein